MFTNSNFTLGTSIEKKLAGFSIFMESDNSYA